MTKMKSYASQPEFGVGDIGYNYKDGKLVVINAEAHAQFSESIVESLRLAKELAEPPLRRTVKRSAKPLKSSSPK